MARFIFCADLHIRFNRPQFRTDDYFSTVENKFSQIVDLANQRSAHIIVAGDLYDSVKAGHRVVNMILENIQRLERGLYLVCGQHDLAFHSKDLSSSPLKTLLFMNNVHLLDAQAPIEVDGEWLYGCSYGDEPIKPNHKDSILVIHHSITREEPPFFLTDALSAKQALDKWKGYYLIVAGDFHQPFTYAKCGTILVNCGPMLRQSIDQMDIKPSVWFADTAKKKLKRVKLAVEPSNEVFDIENIAKKEKSSFAEELGSLVETLKSQAEKPDYRQVVKILVKEINPNQETKDKINYIMGEIGDG